MSLILMDIMDESVPSRDSLFRVSVLFSPTTEKVRSASALECGRINTSCATVTSLGNRRVQLMRFFTVLR